MASGFLKKKNNEKFYPNPNWPVGSIYTTVNNVNPSKWFGGTWELFAPGKCLIGVDPNDNDFKTVKKTGGEKTHKLIANELAPHTHQFWIDKDASGTSFGFSQELINWDKGDNDWANGQFNIYPYHNEATPHNNLQPYITVYFYIRIA